MVLIWWRNMLLPPLRLTPMSAIAFTMYGAIVMFASVCSRSCIGLTASTLPIGRTPCMAQSDS